MQQVHLFLARWVLLAGSCVTRSRTGKPKPAGVMDLSQRVAVPSPKIKFLGGMEQLSLFYYIFFFQFLYLQIA